MFIPNHLFLQFFSIKNNDDICVISTCRLNTHVAIESVIRYKSHLKMLCQYLGLSGDPPGGAVFLRALVILEDSGRSIVSLRWGPVRVVVGTLCYSESAV